MLFISLKPATKRLSLSFSLSLSLFRPYNSYQIVEQSGRFIQQTARRQRNDVEMTGLPGCSSTTSARYRYDLAAIPPLPSAWRIGNYDPVGWKSSKSLARGLCADSAVILRFLWSAIDVEDRTTTAGKAGRRDGIATAATSNGRRLQRYGPLAFRIVISRNPNHT